MRPGQPSRVNSDQRSENAVPALSSSSGYRRVPAKPKLIIQIPCFNEAESLPVALADLPRRVPGFDLVEWLVIDDGSTDATSIVAKQLGVDHVVRHPVNRGLAASFMTGLDAALLLGADVIVNTDADNQYNAGDIPLLTQPILMEEADMVIGARPIDETKHFSWLKKRLQKLGSWAVRVASGTDVMDAPSGFRAMSREVAMQLNVFGAYTYTLETIIQAGLNDCRVVSVPVRTNPDLRPSRLVRSIGSYVRRSVATIFRVFVVYRPMAVFVGLGLLGIFLGLGAGLRFLYFYLSGTGGHVQSVVFSALSIIVGTLLIMMGVIADLIAVNRKLSERVLVRVKRIEMAMAKKERDIGET
jgi:glycosyltransferase involved in cell wall biosynthesis